MEATKDRATEYWDNEIKRAAGDTAKALVAYQIAKKKKSTPFTANSMPTRTDYRKTRASLRSKTTNAGQSIARTSGMFILWRQNGKVSSEEQPQATN